MRFDAHDLVQQQVPAVLTQLPVPRAVPSQEQDRCETCDSGGSGELKPGVGQIHTLGDHMGVAGAYGLPENELGKPGLAARDGARPREIFSLEEHVHTEAL